MPEEKDTSASGDLVFRGNIEGGQGEAFAKIATELVGTDTWVLRTCSKDPTPELADDEQTLCLRIDLDPAALSSVSVPATLPIQGEAQVAVATSSTPATFTAGSGHSPVVTTAWATVVCYSLGRREPLVQQLEGRLELEHNAGGRLAGRVVLSLEGEMRVADCKDFTSADFDYRFDVTHL